MTIDEYLATFADKRYHPQTCNCWHLVEGWLLLHNHYEMVERVRAGIASQRARDAMLNPMWVGKWLQWVPSPQAGCVTGCGHNGVWAAGLVDGFGRPTFWDRHKGLRVDGDGYKVYWKV